MDDDEVVDAAHSVDGDADEAHHNGDENEHKHPLLRALQRFPGRQFRPLSTVCTLYKLSKNCECCVSRSLIEMDS